MDKFQLTNLIIEPLLKEIPHGYSKKAVIAIEMIIAHESLRGKYIRQRFNGPAYGLIGMEELTYNSTWEYGDSIWDNAFNAGIISRDQWKYKIKPCFKTLLYDLQLNIFMARQRLFMKPEAFPDGMKEMSAYLKKHWNSIHGKADNLSYMASWDLWY